MDSALSTAARALSVGDPLGALKLVALRSDAPALALRGIAMAQLGELMAARSLLRRAAAAFGSTEPLARARTVVAQAEVALALRDLKVMHRELEAAARLLARRKDFANSVLARLVQVRRLALLGDVDGASRALSRLEVRRAPPRLAALAGLIAADLATKRVDYAAAARALSGARAAALSARVPALLSEVIAAEKQLSAPVARLLVDGAEHLVSLAELPELASSARLVVDACRREVRLGKSAVSLVKRPLLLELLVALAERAPADAPREELIARAFGARRVNESHRARLRVELGRLRVLLRDVAELRATPAGFQLFPHGGARVLVLLPPAPGEASALLSLLRGGEAWATSALAAALGKSQRAVQRALGELEQVGRAQSVGKGRAQRWVATPSAGIATTLLLVAPGTLG
ncbi:MAG: helix-turn-helix domain-containing protein [Myxococcales bacterium]|nr:MAG: helix-turn-helix domain-containing protein [Myxococcales bacterium]